MSEEQVAKIIEIIEEYNHYNLLSVIAGGCLIVVFIALGIWEYYRLKKIKKYVKEYKATLNKEQLKALEDFKKIND